MRDLARMVFKGEFNELNSWRLSDDPLKQAIYDLSVELKKKERGPEYEAAVEIFRLVKDQVTLPWDTYRVEDEIVRWAEIIKRHIEHGK